MVSGDKRRRRIEDEVDRITELPLHLREHILDSLSIKDAVATSVLSSNWRYCWTGLRKLNFDRNFWDADGDNRLVEHLKHIRAIDRILMLHCGPIREFTLFLTEIEDKTLDINMWLRVLSKNGVQKVEIDAFYYREGLFSIPSGLFNCRELEELSLWKCKLRLPGDFKGFANLTILRLHNVDIASSLLGSLISGCLLLETLSLRQLVLEGPLTLEALNLKTFYFNGRDVWKIIFKDIPKLTRVSLSAIGERDKIDTPQSYERLFSLSMIKKLTYDFCLFEPLPENCPSSTPTLLENLKCLTLIAVNLCLPDDILFALYLLSSAPDLQTLTIHLDSKVRRDFEELHGVAAKLLESEAEKHTSYNSLQTIKIRGIEGLRHESLLIKLLQTRCRKLRGIIIIEKYRFSC